MNESASKEISRRGLIAGDTLPVSDGTGGCGHIHTRIFYGSPSHAPRGSPVEVTKVAPAKTTAGRPAG
jgi:hypothetical protein